MYRLGTLLFLAITVTAIASNALRCPGGQGWNGNGCQACQGGTYSDGVTVDTCQDCPMNTFSESSSSSCKPCTAGSDTRSQSRAQRCQVCDSGYFNPTPGQPCAACAPGSYAPTQGSKQCTPCAPGSFTLDKAARSCQLCQAGDFNPETGQTTCGICPQGYYTPQSGLTACLMCPCGTFNSVVRQSSCQQCPSQNGVIPPSPPASTNSGQCFDLSAMPGFYYGTDKCPISCPGGTYASRIQFGSCQTCPAGTVSPIGSTAASQCSLCPPDMRPNSARTACVPIPSGVPGFVLGKKRAAAFICPKGLQACPVPGRKRGRQAIYECVDVFSNVESCGGCPPEAGGDGEDCTLFDKMAAASCVSGRCDYRCPTGWTSGKNGCQRMSSGQRVLGRR